MTTLRITTAAELAALLQVGAARAWPVLVPRKLELVATPSATAESQMAWAAAEPCSAAPPVRPAPARLARARAAKAAPLLWSSPTLRCF